MPKQLIRLGIFIGITQPTPNTRIGKAGCSPFTTMAFVQNARAIQFPCVKALFF
jgi:hypothetical protein